MLHHNSVLGCCSSVLRNSSSQMFFKTDVLKNFANSTGKHLCRCIFLIRPSSLQLFEKETRSQASLVFFCEIYEFLRKSFYTKYPSGWRSAMLLKRHSNTNVFLEISEIFKSIFFHRTPPVAASVLTQNWYLPAGLDFSLAHFDYFQQVLTRHSLQISLLILSKFQQINQLLHLKPSENLRLSLN